MRAPSRVTAVEAMLAMLPAVLGTGYVVYWLGR